MFKIFNMISILNKFLNNLFLLISGMLLIQYFLQIAKKGLTFFIASLLIVLNNKTSSNKSSIFAISDFVMANTAVKGCCRTKLKPVTKYTHQLICQLCTVVVFKLLVYSVNNRHRPLLYVISLFLK
jgi:hypothetical protein